MKRLNSEEAIHNDFDINVAPIIQQMNQWGAEANPFVFLIDFECKMPRIWPANNSTSDFHYNFNGFTNETASPSVDQLFTMVKVPMSFEAYQNRFQYVQSQLQKGDSFLVNLTAPTSVSINTSMEDIFNAASSKYKCWLENAFVCFSPETFVSIKDQMIRSYPMKGTIDATLPQAKEIILADAKEAAEHATIVDLIRNDLSCVATNVTVSKYRFYHEIQAQDRRIGQVSSEITGKLRADYANHIGDLLFKLLPAGSVSGAPKKKTVEIIRQAEGTDRGYYCGVAGYFDGKDLDSCVLIRFLQENGQYRSGGGITFMSDAMAEYQEMIDKVYVPIH